MKGDPEDLVRRLEEIARELETGTDYTAAATVREAILWINEAWDDAVLDAYDPRHYL